MGYMELLGSVELFEGATQEELKMLASICREQIYPAGEVITAQGDTGDELFIVQSGFVEVIRAGLTPDVGPRTVVNLGEGQIFGEMALVDHGPRSATIKAASDATTVLVIHREDFERACEQNHRLGYIVMRNIAADLSFKLRHRNLTGR
ncbi:MAG: cyclic nucleotide-binding domain-containing protein [Anaerolineales bacterium]|jgi:CRP/FNR family cyclic AMP-dependent transcriptional regulator